MTAAQLVVVVLDVGVEQVQLDPADLGQPDLGVERCAGQVDRDAGAVDQGQGHAVRVEDRVALLLPPVGVEVLAEVPEPVHQPDPVSGDPRLLAALRWSPARTPRPPEYWGRASAMPNSGEK